MFLQQLKVTGFKNISAAQLDFSQRLNCFVGLNGLGKTNCLDAIHYLCLCKSHRGLPDRNLVKHGQDFFRLEALFQDEERASKVVAKFATGSRKEFERNGAAVERLADYVGLYPVVMIAPDDVSLVQEGSEERRRFLDTTLSQISSNYLQQLIQYNNLLRQRNALLKTFAEERRFDAALLSVYDHQMEAPAAVLYQQRREFLARFSPMLSELYALISGQRESAFIGYDTDAPLYGTTMVHLLESHREKDRALQRTTVGPHRDDLNMQLSDLQVKKYASQGQIKSYLLAMRLAQYEILRQEKGGSPLLLLDDIFDKLDAERVQQLIGLIIERDFGQIFITDAQKPRMEAVLAAFPGDHQVFDVTFGLE